MLTKLRNSARQRSLSADFRPRGGLSLLDHTGWRGSGDDEEAEWENICLQKDQNSHQDRERKAVKEHVTQNAAFMSVPIGRGARDDDALGIDYFTHDTSNTI